MNFLLEIFLEFGDGVYDDTRGMNRAGGSLARHESRILYPAMLVIEAKSLNRKKITTGP